MAALNRLLSPAATPTGNAINMDSRTATSTWLNVSIVSIQIPPLSVSTRIPATTIIAIAHVSATRFPADAQPIAVIPDALDPDCEFVVQDMWTEYTGFLEEGCDAALFIGMHAMAGTPDGVMNHTVSGQQWQNLWFNGTLVGETGIHAALCGQWGCPVLLVTGDAAVCTEAQALLGDGLTTVAVKRGIGTFSARQLPAQRAREVIEDGAKRALKDLEAVKPYVPGRPAEIKVEFKVTDATDRFARKAGVERLDARTIVSRGDDWWSAWSQFFF